MWSGRRISRPSRPPAARATARRHFDPSLDEQTLTALTAGGCGGQACEQWHADVTGGVLVGAGVLYVGGSDAIRAFAADGCGAATCPQLASLDMPDGVSGMAVSDGRLVVVSSPPGGGTAFTTFAVP